MFVVSLFINNFTNLSVIPMETKHKEFYAAPSTMVFELKQEGVICASEVFVFFGNSVNDWQDGGTTNEEIFM